MSNASQTLIDLETRFWRALVDQDADTATSLLDEPALMVSAHGAMKFDHATYRRMAEQGPMVLKSFDLHDMEVLFPNDTTAIVTYRVEQRVAARGRDGGKTQQMADSSTWVKSGTGDWRCVMHTETPFDPDSAPSS
jgi:ketosteroid isomerase-like protein